MKVQVFLTTRLRRLPFKGDKVHGNYVPTNEQGTDIEEEARAFCKGGR